MATSATDEWGDFPSSSDLFGGDFFGDELMEMYADTDGGDGNGSHVIASLIGGPPQEVTAAINSGPVKASTEDDTSKHPGVLVALNAAAMDGALASTQEFAPVAAVSKKKATTGKKTSPPKGRSQAAKAPASSSSAPATTANTKRSVATSTPAAQPASKKRKTSPPKAAPAPAPAPIQAKIAPKGGVKVPVPASVKVPSPIASAATANTPALGRVVSSGGTTATAANKTVANKAAANKAAAPAAAVVTRPAASTVPAKKASGPTPVPVKSAVISPNPGVTQVAKPPSQTAKFPALPKPAPTATAAAVVAKKPDVPTSAGGVKRAATEADFKDVASAAVSSLIQNASSSLSKQGPPKASAKPTEKVDTSTAHVNALTSQNWVTACNPVPGTTESQSACDKAARNARRANLTQEERAKQNRDRNREHARNTRLRKKAYVEELKRTLTELVAQRDSSEVEKRHEAQRNREQREVRFRVMEEFLKLRGRNETNSARWIAILEDGFTFTLPRTTYRQIVDGEKSQVSDSTSRASLEQVLRGADAVMDDSKHLSDFLQTIGGDASDASSQVQISHRCDRKRFFMDDNIAFMDFAASTIGAVNKGASNEIFFKGSMRASFSPASNKLISVDLTFDTGCVVHQLERLGMSTPNEANAAAAAAEAENLLDSLQMPQIFAEKKDATGPVSVSSDDGERSTDGNSSIAA
jgi:hypothetical protein